MHKLLLANTGVNAGVIAGAIIGLAIIIFLISGIRIVKQTHIYIVERLGSYSKTLGNGFHWIIPVIDRVVMRENLKERVLDFPKQDVITKDNVTVQMDTVVYIRITDPKAYSYGTQRPIFAIENLAATTLRNLVGELELDQTYTSRDTVNEKLRVALDDATDPWGIKVLRVEIKNIIPPIDVRRAMEKQMRAEREKREKILIAEGERQSAILKAEGEKRSAILKAEGNRESAILNAEGVKKALELINSANPTAETLKLKSFEALTEVSKGESTNLIIPSEISSLAAIAGTFKQVSSALDKKEK